MYHLCPEIPTNSVVLVDTLVQPLNCRVDRARSVLLNQFTH